jgi:predicted nucleic acid-binding protein
MNSESTVVVDATFLTDLFLSSRVRNPFAVRASKILMGKRARVIAPYHSIFEVSSALRWEKAHAKAFVPCPDLKDFRYLALNIDKAFLEKYLDTSLPRLKAGDSLYLAVAKKESAILITNDSELGKVGNSCGVEALTVEEFVARYE